ncbi:proline racemase family protein [Spiractinospora alimapuensis]|uniref:proline racemase family protein n=1 Tax=Spiractinospora alimapuensis TaxID=2820884 RepID=UPI001F3AAD4D|nr:proline racemase family protein [Spiractinospora alimapuensis]QVQ53464.1 proline racemase family protein [Spiractinospora alimapuensis]
MRAGRYFSAVDSHTEGMPTRVVTGGVGPVPGATMAERRTYFMEHLDHIRELLVNEPRGHAAMSGAILQPPSRPDADWGVIYIEVSGCLPMCGHGTIGVATVLVETGMVEVTEPVTEVRLDTPAGLVTARVSVTDGRAESVTIRNVASFSVAHDATVRVPGIGDVRYDMAYGGNFYAIVPIEDLGIPFDKAEKDRMATAGLAIMDAINAQNRPVHPIDPTIAGCKHVQLTASGGTGADARNAMVIHPGWFDRSPCGTGTSARMAQLHSRGELAVGQDFVNQSLLGTSFTGRLLEETDVGGLPAVVPTVTGRAWITAMGQYLLDPDDPFPRGFTL